MKVAALNGRPSAQLQLAKMYFTEKEVLDWRLGALWLASASQAAGSVSFMYVWGSLLLSLPSAYDLPTGVQDHVAAEL